jgi:hypothetical protein
MSTGLQVTLTARPEPAEPETNPRALAELASQAARQARKAEEELAELKARAETFRQAQQAAEQREATWLAALERVMAATREQLDALMERKIATPAAWMQLARELREARTELDSQAEATADPSNREQVARSKGMARDAWDRHPASFTLRWLMGPQPAGPAS